jgi:hypothetical protein
MKPPVLLYLMAAMSAAAWGLPRSLPPYQTGATSAKPHDPERLKAAELKRERKAAKRRSTP